MALHFFEKTSTIVFYYITFNPCPNLVDFMLTARVMVQQWGHLRWGLGSEYPRQGEQPYYLDPSTCSPYLPCERVPIAPIRCADKLVFYPAGDSEDECKVVNSTSLPNDKCSYEPQPMQQVTASLMYDMYSWDLVSVDLFLFASRCGYAWCFDLFYNFQAYRSTKTC